MKGIAISALVNEDIIISFFLTFNYLLHFPSLWILQYVHLLWLTIIVLTSFYSKEGRFLAPIYKYLPSKYVVFRFSAFCNILLFLMLWKIQSEEEINHVVRCKFLNMKLIYPVSKHLNMTISSQFLDDTLSNKNMYLFFCWEHPYF